ncbi:Gp9 protein [Candidatus Vecturithrix granuli]|uniref:Gp9 protein n=1 Tax=Vecturithrix granuli TaxID=1499967 RepID=A0A081CAZ8_VECG1|nr:Gp9 protein [Candidatus Vecturithrix granuli]
MSLYKKKPVVIEARQFVGDNANLYSIYQWIEQNTAGSFEPLAVIEGKVPCPKSGVSIDPRDGRMMIATLEGFHHVNVGDYIIRGIKGEFYPCKPDIFEATYELFQ